MIKKVPPRKDVPQILVPASPSAFTKAASMTSPSTPPEILKVSRQDILSKLMGAAKGWDAEIEALFELPDSLFKIQEDTAVYYSKNKSFGISSVLDSLQFGKLPNPLPEYGISLYSTGGTVSFILIDKARNIIVRERLFSVHDANPEKDWSVVKTALKAALTGSESARKEGAVAVFDGSLRVIKPE